MKLSTPFRLFIAGPSESGKTTWLINLIKWRAQLIDKPFSRICLCYSTWQPAYEKLRQIAPDTVFIDGMPPLGNDFWSSIENSLLVLDDLAGELFKEAKIAKLVTVDSHHRNISVCLISQNLFPQGKKSREISLNMTYLNIFKSPRDLSQINYIARQIDPHNWKSITETYQNIIEKNPHQSLFIDLSIKTPRELLLRSYTFENNTPNMAVYVK